MYARYFKIENDIIQYDKNKIKFTDMDDKLYIKNVIKCYIPSNCYRMKKSLLIKIYITNWIMIKKYYFILD